MHDDDLPHVEPLRPTQIYLAITDDPLSETSAGPDVLLLACILRINALLAEPWSPAELAPRAEDGFRPWRLFEVSHLGRDLERRLTDLYRDAGWVVAEESLPAFGMRWLRFLPPADVAVALLDPAAGEP